MKSSKPKLLVVGDSFSANLSSLAWQNLLDEYTVINLSSAGSSEYRILKKLLATDLDLYSATIVVHTSPNRIYVEHNPLHQSSFTHQHCDLIYQDVVARRPDPWADRAAWWFENVFDVDYAYFMHKLMIDRSVEYTRDRRALHLTFFELEHTPSLISLHDIWKQHPGSINHLSELGNQLVADLIKQKL